VPGCTRPSNPPLPAPVSANLIATDTTFSTNTGAVGGAAYIHGSDAFTQSFTGCTFTGNSDSSTRVGRC
jgi:hypothetical protein